MPTSPRSATTLVEISIVVVIMSLACAATYRIMSGFLGHGAKGITQKMHLQMEARRALVNLYREIQEGIEILKPEPGSTLPYLVLRDNVNNIHFIFLKKDQAQSRLQNSLLFKLHSVVYDIPTEKASAPREIVANVESMNFTAHGYGDVVITSTLREGNSSFSFVNMIGLRNALAEEGM